jgi:hypothetical protein
VKSRLGSLAIAALCIAVGAFAVSTASANWGADPAVRKWPSWPYPTTCGYRLFDPISIFSAPATAEFGSTPAERALRRFLRHPVIPWVPRHNWRLLYERGRTAEFVSSPLSSDPRNAPEQLLFERRGRRWKWTGSGPCVPASVIEGHPAVYWDLPEDHAKLTPETSEIEVNLGPGECASGRSQNKRAHPVFTEVDGKLLLTIWLTPVHGGGTCIGISEPPLKVQLPEPLGQRELFDGGTYPPHLATGSSRY